MKKENNTVGMKLQENWFSGIRKSQPGKKMGLHKEHVWKSAYLFVSGLVILMLSLSSCTSGVAEPLPLAGELYAHPGGLFSLPIPEGWTVTADIRPQVVWLNAPEDGLEVSVVMISEKLTGNREAEMAQAAQDLLAAYMMDFLPYADYEIVNQVELRVDRNPAILLDFARPLDDGYHTGRMVLIHIPGYLVFLVGFGPREDWDSFLPTFRLMLDGMTFAIELFPTEE